MKVLLIMILVSTSLLTFSQEKALQEQFGFWRIHKVESFSIDTTYNDNGSIKSIDNVANMVIYREGIDGNYKVVVAKSVYGNVNKTIEYLALEPEYDNYKIVEK